MRQEDIERFEGAIFRANAAFELVLFDRLTTEQQQLLSALQKDAGFYGVLRPLLQLTWGVRSIDRDTALLFFTLQVPGHIPAYVKFQLGDRYHKTILKLVLDNVLEIKWQDTWVSGMEFYSLFFPRYRQSVAQNAITLLSLEAIKYAQTFASNDSTQISTRLYCYNRVPLSSHWWRKFPTTASVAAYLDLPHPIMKQQWVEVPSSSSSSGWFTWSARHIPPEPHNPHFVYKLYVSPACSHIRDAFHTTMQALSDSQAVHCKIGNDVYGLLRPDKFVVYFTTMQACQETATLLMQQLAGLPAHGVPFSSEIGGDGLLSWGIDPPAQEQTFNGQYGESWRLWVTNRLAAALLTAKSAQSADVEPWQFALERLRLDDVNIETWTPPQLSWQPQAKE